MFSYSQSPIAPGDHIFYDCGHYQHHGIYCGDFHYDNRLYKDVVIHYQVKHNKGKIRGLSYEKFASSRDIYKVLYKTGHYDNNDVVVKRAISRLGEPDYNLFGNNCEHFAHYCKTGESISGQVHDYTKMGLELVGGAIGAIAVVAILPVEVPVAVGVGVAMAGGYAVQKAVETVSDWVMNPPHYRDSW